MSDDASSSAEVAHNDHPQHGDPLEDKELLKDASGDEEADDAEPIDDEEEEQEEDEECAEEERTPQYRKFLWANGMAAAQLPRSCDTPEIRVAGRDTVAPSVNSEGVEAENTYNSVVKPIGCWKIDDFAFRGVFPTVEKPRSGRARTLDTLRKEFAELRKLHEYLSATYSGKAGRRIRVAIFGHSDAFEFSQGDGHKVEATHRRLSQARAEIVYALLTRKVDRFIRIFHTFRQQDALKENLRAAGLPVSRPGVRAFVNRLCGRLRLRPERDFVGNGAQAHQGCGVFNPIRIPFSQKREDLQNSHPAIMEHYGAVNRRVVVLFFKPQVDPRLPCGRQQCKDGLRKDWPESIGRHEAERGKGDPRGELYFQPGKTFGCQRYLDIKYECPCQSEDYRARADRKPEGRKRVCWIHGLTARVIHRTQLEDGATEFPGSPNGRRKPSTPETVKWLESNPSYVESLYRSALTRVVEHLTSDRFHFVTHESVEQVMKHRYHEEALRDRLFQAARVFAEPLPPMHWPDPKYVLAVEVVWDPEGEIMVGARARMFHVPSKTLVKTWTAERANAGEWGTIARQLDKLLERDRATLPQQLDSFERSLEKPQREPDPIIGPTNREGTPQVTP